LTPELQKRLAAPFPAEDERTFTGRANQTFTYIEDERVMDRLDENGVPWQLEVTPIDIEKGIAKIALLVYDVELAVWRRFEDFGYHTREGGESLKEAVSDGIRRVGRMAGIGRYLYTRQERQQPRPPAPRPQVVAEKEEDPGAAKPSQAMVRKLMATFGEKNLSNAELRQAYTKSITGKGSSKDLTVADVEKLLVSLADFVGLVG
jgi:hypothetical protein